MNTIKRRDFIRTCGIAWAAALAARPLTLLAAEKAGAPAVLNPARWQTITAICERLIPAVDGFGATTANCANFIDKALVNEESATRPMYLHGLTELERATQAQWQRTFTDLDDARQVQCLEQLEDGALPGWQGAADQAQWFATLRFHTILGFLAAPKYGGNRDLVGWRATHFPGHLHEAGGLSDAQVSGAEPIRIDFSHSH